MCENEKAEVTGMPEQRSLICQDGGECMAWEEKQRWRVQCLQRAGWLVRGQLCAQHRPVFDIRRQI